MGLLPDLELAAEKQPEPLISFSYDNTLDEIDGAMKTFQQKFSGKRGILITAAYLLFLIAGIAALIIDYTQILAYAAICFCIYGLVYSLTDKSRMRKRTIEALKDMKPEEYNASFFEDRIELETIIKEKENEVNVKIDEEADEEIISSLKSVFVFETDMLDFAENDESLLLVYNRRQIYCFPKRCLSAQQEEQVRDFLNTKLC